MITAAGKGFVELVERDAEASAEAVRCVGEAMHEMLQRGADHIVLGCTHYPFLLDTMRKVAEGYAVTFVDSSQAVARRVGQLLDQYALRAEEGHCPDYRFETFADEPYRRRLQDKALAE